MGCELSNVFGSMVALLLSILGATICILHQGSTEAALQAAGSGTATLGSMSSNLSFNFAVILLLNVISTAVISLSTFECSHLASSSVMHCLTKSTSLCWWTLLACCTFLVQLVVSGFMLVATVLVGFLVFVCHSGEDNVTQMQQLLYAVGNMTSPGGEVFNPYGAQDIQDSPVISLEHIVSHLDLARFCGVAQDLDGAVANFWLGCLLTVVSQALMTVALHGEKERVSVHEVQEKEASIFHIGYSPAVSYS